MTENNRFTVPVKYSLSHSKIQLNGQPLTNAEIVRLLNANDGAFVKNFNLKREIEELKKENEQLKQFKGNVIKWVDSQMKFNDKKNIESEDYHFKSENIDLHNFKVFIGIDSDE